MLLYSYLWLNGLIEFDCCLSLNDFVNHGICILAAERSAKDATLNQLLYAESQTCLEYEKKIVSLEQQSKFYLYHNL